MEEIIINVEGMMCGGCENRIQNALKEIDGVESVIANHKDGTVKVTKNASVEESLLTERIIDLGFDIK